MAVLIGFMAMAIDVGLLFEDRRHYQNSADAMALAGVAELPLSPATASTNAMQWAANNNIDSGDIKTVEVRTTASPTTPFTSSSKATSTGSSDGYSG
jgi:Flp pilus assembly protein TadG